MKKVLLFCLMASSLMASVTLSPCGTKYNVDQFGAEIKVPAKIKRIDGPRPQRPRPIGQDEWEV